MGGEAEAKTGAAPFGAFDDQRTAESPHDACHGSQAEAATCIFGRKERIEDAISVFFENPIAGIGNLQDHGGGFFYLRTNDQARDFRLMRAPVGTPGRAHWSEVLPARDGVLVEDHLLLRGFLIVQERRDGLIGLRVRDLGNGEEHLLAFDEPAYFAYLADNRDFGATSLRYAYTSLTTQLWAYDCNGTGVFDGNGNYVSGCRRVLATYEWDQYGNMTREYKHGNYDVSGDEWTAARSFAPNASAYIVGLPAWDYVYAGLGTGGTMLSGTRYYYDDAGTLGAAPTALALSALPLALFLSAAALFLVYGTKRLGTVWVLPQWVAFLGISALALVGLA